MRDSKTVKKTAVRFLAAGIVLLILLLGISACSGTNSGTQAVGQPGKIIEENNDVVTIVDQAGRTVTVPKEINSIAISYRVVARFVITLGEGEKIKGIGKTEDFLFEIAPALKDAVDVGKGVPDLEAIAELKPDIYFHKATDRDGLDRVEELGIPAVGLSFENPEEMKTALGIMGAVLGKKERAAELVNYYDQRIEEDKEQAEQVTDKKTAIVMGSSIGKVADGSMLQSAMIEYAGGISAAADMQATELWPTAGTEQIFKWDPDFIFITGSEGASYGPEDIYSNPAWSELKAVKENHIYVMPAEKDSWEFPGVVSVLGIDYMKSKMYPELLSEEDLQKNIDEFYELSYGRTFTREELGY